MPNFNTIGYQVALFGFVRLSNIWRLASRLISIDPRNILILIDPRHMLFLFLIFGTSLSSFLLSILEKVFYGRQIAKVQIEHPPIFIIGHYRSGTTYLQNLITQDSSFGYLSMYQALVPDFSLIGRQCFQPLLSNVLPIKRLFDNMTWPMDAPTEDEIPLAKTMPYNFMTSMFMFPRTILSFFRKYVMFQEAPAWVITEFKRKYYRILQIATIHADYKRLVLKNPVNTVRVRLLLELFPNAKFIHIFRSPYDVMASTWNMKRKVRSIAALQTVSSEEAIDNSLTIYEEMMKRYFADRSLIPKHDLVEVRYEDLEHDPLAELQRVYETLNLPGYTKAEPFFQSYIESQKDYKKNCFELSNIERKLIEQRCSIGFTELGYGVDLGESVDVACPPEAVVSPK